MRAAIYVRVSTKEQSVDNQIKICEKFCNLREWEVPIIYSDTISGLLFIGWLEDVLGFHSAELEYNTERNKRFIAIENRLIAIQTRLDQ